MPSAEGSREAQPGRSPAKLVRGARASRPAPGGRARGRPRLRRGRCRDGRARRSPSRERSGRRPGRAGACAPPRTGPPRRPGPAPRRRHPCAAPSRAARARRPGEPTRRGRTLSAYDACRLAAPDRAHEHAAEICEAARACEPSPGDDGDVRGQVRPCRVAGRRATADRVDPSDREVPPGEGRREQARRRGDVDEALDAPAEAPRQDSRELDLEAPRQDHVASPHHAGLQPRVPERETDDERAGRRRRRDRRWGRVRADHRRHQPDAHEQGHEQRYSLEASHTCSQTTSTGVPCVANAYISGASRAIMRTQPCEAGYVGTGQYSCIAIPPVK